MPSPVNFNLLPPSVCTALNAPLGAALRGLAQRLPPLWPAHCLVCREPCLSEPGQVAAKGLCLACRACLPWNRSACARCALPMPAPTAACGRCLRHPPPLADTRAVFVYGPPLDRLLPRLKFHDDLAAGRLLAELMAESIAETFACAPAPGSEAIHNPCRSARPDIHENRTCQARPDALVPLSLHRRRLRARGYDQALELARPLARILDIPLRGDLLHRVRDTAPQSRLDAPGRRKNLRGAFAANRDAITRSTMPLKHVVLIDDVMTTGATLHAAADALLRAGIQRVDAWVCARVK
jgi:ComF family protein